MTRLLTSFKRLTDINEDRVLDALKKIKGKQTRNHYLQAVRQFVYWAIAKRRLKDDPLLGLEAENVKTDPNRKTRRALTIEEVDAVLRATMLSTKVVRKLTGQDRCILYLVAATTGLRASELQSLRPCDFVLEGDAPAILLAAADDKARRGAEQPLPPAIVSELQRYLAGKKPGEKVWPSSWPEKAWKMVREDLQAAGIAHKTSEGCFDFHGWRHTYISLLAATGLQPKMVQDLARHTDIRLTMSRYAHTQREQRSQAISTEFPSLFPSQRENWGELVIQSDNRKVKKTPRYAILPTGFEPVTYGLGNREHSSKTTRKQGVCKHCHRIPIAIPIELAGLIKAWAKLTEKVRKSILMLAG